MPKRFTLTFSDDLYAAVQLLRQRRKYRTDSEYFAALARYDGQTQRDHHLTAEWAALKGYERDRLDAAILRQVESGAGCKGSWLEQRIEAIVQRHVAATNGQAPATATVAAELAREVMARDLANQSQAATSPPGTPPSRA